MPPRSSVPNKIIHTDVVPHTSIHTEVVPPFTIRQSFPGSELSNSERVTFQPRELFNAIELFARQVRLAIDIYDATARQLSSEEVIRSGSSGDLARLPIEIVFKDGSTQSVPLEPTIHEMLVGQLARFESVGAHAVVAFLRTALQEVRSRYVVALRGWVPVEEGSHGVRHLLAEKQEDELDAGK